ncbi:DUF427 domain-containing protein [Streptomyces flavofungini]|uniref:DUF427 domain-containing protein n=1 Tax=Streptomyces flavofungini TaxID=68200 RepID=A0ABS0WZN6_9ACTN|nr:DUF427 domain-containing protein [Streptomyces flavofungini]
MPSTVRSGSGGPAAPRNREDQHPGTGKNGPRGRAEPGTRLLRKATTVTQGHRITVEQGTQHVRVEQGGQVVAESKRPLLLRETGFPVRYYLPPEDVRTDLLAPSDTHTYCPFKGTASYWSLPDTPDAVWAYPDPKPEVAEIKDHFCFYEVAEVPAA